jgi:hypothetical protein
MGPGFRRDDNTTKASTHATELTMPPSARNAAPSDAAGRSMPDKPVVPDT